MMEVSYPSYFEKFRCIAGGCPDSCCRDWDVLVDDEAAARYEALDGPLGIAIREKLQRDESGSRYFAITEGRCPMWRSDGLCRIQAALGHEALCETCRQFPRLTHDYGDFVEKGLALSCPEAARLILSGPHDWVTRQLPGGEPGDYDRADMAQLLETREVMLTILSDPANPVPQALALGLLYGYHAQNLLDGGEETAFDAAAALDFGRGFAKKPEIAQLTAFYGGLEILTEEWKTMLKNPEPASVWEEKLRYFAICGVERYWLQAISDFDLIGRVKMVIAGCILVHALGGDVEVTAQKYAKEIENSAENVETLLDGAYTSPALTDDKLLGWLL